jgi:predicted phage tail protein
MLDVLVQLAWFRNRLGVARLGKGFGIFHATAYRYVAEAIEVLAAEAPDLRRRRRRRKSETPARFRPRRSAYAGVLMSS